MTAAVRFECVALDCSDPYELASFYAGVLGWEIHSDSEPDDSWVTLSNPDGGADICFQLDPEYQAPTWPSNERAQMLHLDFEVTDIAAEHERVLALGARLLDGNPERFRVYADPAGHPFCLVW